MVYVTVEFRHWLYILCGSDGYLLCIYQTAIIDVDGMLVLVSVVSYNWLFIYGPYTGICIIFMVFSENIQDICY
jgi:hypothetical protein